MLINIGDCMETNVSTWYGHKHICNQGDEKNMEIILKKYGLLDLGLYMICDNFTGFNTHDHPLFHDYPFLRLLFVSSHSIPYPLQSSFFYVLCLIRT